MIDSNGLIQQPCQNPENVGLSARFILSKEILDLYKTINSLNSTFCKEGGAIDQYMDKVAEILSDTGNDILKAEAMNILVSNGILNTIAYYLSTRTMIINLMDCGVNPDLSNIAGVFTPIFGVETPQAIGNVMNVVEIIQTLQASVSVERLQVFADMLSELQEVIMAKQNTMNTCSGKGV